MLSQLRSFLEFLRLNRNVSAHTLRAYESDLTQFVSFMADTLERPAESVGPAEFD